MIYSVPILSSPTPIPLTHSPPATPASLLFLLGSKHILPQGLCMAVPTTWKALSLSLPM